MTAKLALAHAEVGQPQAVAAAVKSRIMRARLV